MKQPQLSKEFEDWFRSSLPKQLEEDVTPGTAAVLLQVLEDLKYKYDLEYQNYLTAKGAQIKDISGSRVKKILARYGETRKFLSEGGRTSRGGPRAVEKMLPFFKELIPHSLDESERFDVLSAFQLFLVDRIREFFDRQKVKLVFDSRLSTWQIIHNLIKSASKKAGYVVQHLVGAKLELRFPDIAISNESGSTADAPTNRGGDFTIGNTVFHVTMSPKSQLFDKCLQNLREGLKVYLIVPDSLLAGTRQLANQFCSGQIAVESIESFLSQNIDEISIFKSDHLKKSLVSLINIYNRRVMDAEVDMSLMIELPSNLEKYDG